jgi:hypothetical protein
MKRQSRRARRGAILLAALVCLTIVVSIVGSMLLAALASGRQVRTERDLRQCELLLQAGVDRALYRGARQSGYSGETWAPAADEIIGTGEGRVTIEAARDGSPAQRQFVITAEYPAGSEFSIRRSRTIHLSENQSAEQEP